ncbi:valine--tRNA ligase [Patescibacteria group bacterium]|nr:valine--tRNA ligase [Patescibacteria group bacterium]
MDKAYQSAHESDIYRLWEQSGAFTPVVPSDPVKAREAREPFTIILPPPNANNPLHAGHIMYVVEDILVRYHRMLGDPTLWLPGTDHAGIESQFVFEKELKKQGRSRFDYDRQTLYRLIDEFVAQNKDIAISQLKMMGFSLDWTRLKFTLDPDHVARIYAVFNRMHHDGLVYRDEKIVNYCTFCGTAFSNLEVVHKTVNGHLWYINYGPLSVATTRPETMLGDTAVAVNPSDIRYQKLIGTKLKLPLVGREIPIIGEESVDPEFGTGAVKVTPSHSPEDYDMGKKFHLEFIRIFDYDGRANANVPEKYRSLYPQQVREAVVRDLEAAGLLEKVVDYSHEVGHCYKCGRPIEPITAPQWFIKVKTLADQALQVVQDDTIKIFPKRFKKSYLTWMKNLRDWPVSRQIVWGHRLPIWYNLDENPDTQITFIDKSGKNITDLYKNLKDNFDFAQIKNGLQSLIAPVNAKYYLTEAEALQAGEHTLQETDTFDTWFSSGQWPYSTLGFNPEDPSKSAPDFKYFYPTSLLDTMWDILFFWVARMIMFGLYVTGKVPFEVVHLHSRVNDAQGQKMSKSRGNVINPSTFVAQYGADALRFALVYGVAPGSDISLSEDKLRAQRNFVNKLWNAARFIELMVDKVGITGFSLDPAKFNADDKAIIAELNRVIAATTKNINRYHFGAASEDLYQFFWHQFCDIYIEKVKDRPAEALPVLAHVLLNSLKLLHPFIPFVTETIYQTLKEKLHYTEALLITAAWPQND